MLNNARNIKLFGVMAIIIILAAGYFLVLAPILQQREELNETGSSSTSQLSTLQTQLQQAQAAANNYQANVERNQAIDTAMPAPNFDDNLTEQVYQAADRAGLSRDNITSLTISAPVIVEATQPAETPAAATEEDAAEGESTQSAAPAPSANTGNGNFASSEVSIAANGSLEQVSNFLQQIQQMQRAIKISNVVFSGGENGISLAITGSVYVYKANTFEVPPAPSDIQSSPTIDPNVDPNTNTVVPPVENSVTGSGNTVPSASAPAGSGNTSVTTTTP